MPDAGEELVLDVGPVAHGGHCVARHHGQVVFVRHTLPGERVRARVTGTGGGGRFLRADAVEVLTAAPGRVPPRCPFSGPGRCGGCDFQHVALATQRELLADVVREQFTRLARTDVEALLGRPVVVEPVPGDEDGLRWRTRTEFAVGPDGRPGLRVHRSHEVVPVTDCPITDRRVVGTGVLEGVYPGLTSVDVVAPSVGEPVVVPVPAEQPVPVVHEQVGEHRFAVSARGFWQVHPGAARTFVDLVGRMLQPRTGERVLDLYAGVGLFAAGLAERVGPSGSVVAVEGDRVAVSLARENLATWPWARARRERVDRAVATMARRRIRVDTVVLDPPRTGAGAAVVRDVASLRPRAVAYVACDPAALARDVAAFDAHGYVVRDLRVLDAFPMTHHVECIALLEPAPRGAGGRGRTGAQ